ncbi:MAG TPA: SEC-C metal-binding domain-containing protein [Gemmatimonadaceae bacterium]|jgi:hypothetical protein
MPGRNDPCFCGSGKKYKKCHLALEQATAARSPVHDLDERVSTSMLSFGAARFGEDFERHVKTLPSTLPFDEIQRFALPFLLYEAPLDGRLVAETFLKEQARMLSEREREWIERQLQAWLTIWEVTAVNPGRTVSLVDRITGQPREVEEVSASRSLRPLDHVLGRVTDFENSSLLCGMHPYPLPPRAVEEVIAAMPREANTIETLRNYESASLLLRLWEQAVNRLIERHSRPPDLQNTDGDLLILVVDHFRFDPAHRREIEHAISALPGISAGEANADATEFHILRPDETVIGSLTVGDGSLRASTNSVRRADDLRIRVEKAAGQMIQHRARELADPLHEFGKAGTAITEDLPPDPEFDEVIRQQKEKHYASWLDEPVPALQGKTPRQAVKSKRHRKELELLLRDLEHIEGRLPPSQRFDVNVLYGALGMDRRKQTAAQVTRKKTGHGKREKTRRIIDAIFGEDANEELGDLLRKADPLEARHYLLEKLRDDYQVSDGFTALMILDRIGVGAELQRFSALVLDSTAPIGARAAALNVVSGEDEPLADRLMNQLGPEEAKRLAEEPLREMMKMILTDADFASMPVSFFGESGEDWERTFDRVESLRCEFGVSAATFYEWLVRAEWLSSRMRDEILDAVTAEGGELGALLIDQLREETKDRGERARLQGALTRIRTAIAGGQPAPFSYEGYAILEPFDFFGHFGATVVQEWSANEYLAAQLIVDSRGAAIGGAGFETEDTVARLESDDLVARTDAGVAASLVRHALRNRVRADQHDGATEAAIRVFQRVPVKPVPSPEPANIDRDAFEALFARKEYETWFFVDEELGSAKILIPTVEPDRRWYKRTIAKLNRPKIRQRLRSQTEYMSRWHFLRGEKTEASLMARLSADLNKGFESSPLVKAMLERVVGLHKPIPRKEMSATSDAIVEAVESGKSSAGEMMKILRKIVANQMRHSSPPQVRETLERLQREGIPRTAARDMICVALHADLLETLNTGRHYDEASYVAKLRRLPKLPA